MENNVSKKHTILCIPSSTSWKARASVHGGENCKLYFNKAKYELYGRKFLPWWRLFMV